MEFENFENEVTGLTAVQFTQTVSQQKHAMAGAVIALSAAQAVALGLACMQIGQDGAAHRSVERIGQIQAELLQWCNRDATAIAKYVALRDAGDVLAGQRLLCNAPAAVSRLAIEAAYTLQYFRPSVVERVADDLEMSICLLAGSAQAAMLLLDSNLRIWAEEAALLAEFEPILEELILEIAEIDVVARIASR